MARLYIPACGDRLTLTAPWKSTFFFEYRNVSFAKMLGLLPDIKSWNSYEGQGLNRRLRRVEAELPAGTILECDRVYIRQYNKSRVNIENDYDSITWRIQKIKGKEGKGKPSGRFWVKLPDCYTIEYEQSIDSLYRDRIKLVKDVLGQ